jgi:lipoprotein-anchoring transpeptidase ErfK/SrfK
MATFKFSKLAMEITAAALIGAQAIAQNAPANAASKAAADAVHSRMIVVSLEDRKLALVEDGKVLKVFPVAVGKPTTPSPVGTFTIKNHVVNPTYSHDGRVIPAGPHNPVGTRWMGLSLHGYGIHGTNEPKSIGKAASHGCIRMAKADLEQLYPMVAVGDTVELVGERNEETAQLFGDSAKTASATLLAANEPAKTSDVQSETTSTSASPTTTKATVSAVVAEAAVTGSF